MRPSPLSVSRHNPSPTLSFSQCGPHRSLTQKSDTVRPSPVSVSHNPFPTLSFSQCGPHRSLTKQKQKCDDREEETKNKTNTEQATPPLSLSIYNFFLGEAVRRRRRQRKKTASNVQTNYQNVLHELILWSIVVLWNKLGSLWLGRFTSFGDIASIRRKTSQNTNTIQEQIHQPTDKVIVTGKARSQHVRYTGRFTSFGDIADIRRQTSGNTNKIQ